MRARRFSLHEHSSVDVPADSMPVNMVHDSLVMDIARAEAERIQQAIEERILELPQGDNLLREGSPFRDVVLGPVIDAFRYLPFQVNQNP